MKKQSGSFLVGVASGVVLVILGLILFAVLAAGSLSLPASEVVGAQLQHGWELIHLNLRGSLPVFLLVLLAYLVQVRRLRSLLASTGTPLARILRHEQLLDLCANLFFGTGVIWTAIGMRDSLLYALGDVGAAGDQGAFSVLQQMVDGGILLALSTTIVGGIGGYLMRAAKSVFLGQQLAYVYLRAQNRQAEEGLAALQRIEHLLHSVPNVTDDSLAAQ